MTYEYTCKNCRKKFEVSLSIHDKDKPHVQCQWCGSDTVRRVYEPVPFILKGDGYYNTDNRKEE